MRLLYSLAWILALPLAFLHLLWRARKQPDYLRHWPERLGWVPAWSAGPRLWIHAVSVGETRAAAPLIVAWRARHPDIAILLTHTTPTGRETGQALFGELNNSLIVQAYLPYDFPPLVWLFLKRARPSMGVIMETEIWPNLFAACESRDLPLFLVNARLSERSARGYARFHGLVEPALKSLSGLAAQTADDASRFANLGALAVQINGNLKFDVAAPPETAGRAEELRQLFGGRFVWLAASTREGEESLLLAALEQLALPDVLLVLVPRHPQRFAEVARLIAARGRPWARRGESRKAGHADVESKVVGHIDVFLGDSMGEMAAYYAAADVAYIGGSLLPFGGQNLIEAAAGAARRIADADALLAALQELHANKASLQAMAFAGRDFAAGNRGATQRTLELLETAWKRLRVDG